MATKAIKLCQRADGWWITNTPEGVDEMGPFPTKAEAQESRRRLEAFLANCDKRGFITSCK